MARRQCTRSKPKKKLNRYNPNAPSWAEVHAPWWRLRTRPTATMPVDPSALVVAAALRAARKR